MVYSFGRNCNSEAIHGQLYCSKKSGHTNWTGFPIRSVSIEPWSDKHVNSTSVDLRYCEHNLLGDLHGKLAYFFEKIPDSEICAGTTTHELEQNKTSDIYSNLASGSPMQESATHGDCSLSNRTGNTVQNPFKWRKQYSPGKGWRTRKRVATGLAKLESVPIRHACNAAWMRELLTR